MKMKLGDVLGTDRARLRWIPIMTPRGELVTFGSRLAARQFITDHDLGDARVLIAPEGDGRRHFVEVLRERP